MLATGDTQEARLMHDPVSRVASLLSIALPPKPTGSSAVASSGQHDSV